MNKANIMAIQIVRNYISRLERQPMGYWRSSEFAQLSYSKSAARDLLNLLQDKTDTPPLVVIEEYRDKMNDYSCLNPMWSFMHSVAADTADSIIDELIGSYY